MSTLTESTHFVSTASGHALALRQVDPPTAHIGGPAVLCIHGLFSDSRFFLGASGKGPARTLLDSGYRVFLGELRGHGRSRWPQGPARNWDWGFDDYVSEDLPALVQAARASHPGPLYVVCHSMSGYALLAALGLSPLLRRSVAGIGLFASAVNDYSEQPVVKRIAFAVSDWISRGVGRFPARHLRVGVSDEPQRLFRQFRAWAADGSFASHDGGTDYWRSVEAVDLPIWAAVGSADRFHASVPRGRKLLARMGTPPEHKEFIELGRRNGFSRDFGHVDAVRGEAACSEVWPRLLRWLESRSAGPEA